MAANPETYDILFRLLKSEEIAEKAFDLLQRLPVSHKV